MSGIRLQFRNRDLIRDAIYVALWLYLFYNISNSALKMWQSNISIAFKSKSASSMLYPSMTFCPKLTGLTVGTEMVIAVFLP